MKSLAFLLRRMAAVLFIFVPATLAHDTLIVVDVPYDTGSFWLSTAFRDNGSSDSVRFDNGLAIAKSIWGTATEGQTWGGYGGFTFDTGSLRSAGYRPDTSMRREPFVEHGTITYGSIDTRWEGAAKFPDSLMSLDSVTIYVPFLFHPDTTTHYRTGKWLVKSLYDLYSPPIIGFIDNYNAIVYVKCLNGASLKFQASGFDTGNGGVQRVQLRWAVDSAGNGDESNGEVATASTTVPSAFVDN